MIPCKREDELVVEHTDVEVLVYDLRTDDAHHLDAAAASVWQACDGERSVEEIAAETGLSTEAVTITVANLVDLDLVSIAGAHSRREMLSKSLKGAGLIAALPVIASIAAPEAAMAATLVPSGGACTTGSQCASPGICTGGVCQ